MKSQIIFVNEDIDYKKDIVTKLVPILVFKETDLCGAFGENV